VILGERVVALVPCAVAAASATGAGYLVENWRGVADALASVLP
jgi:hypothetical protein